MARKKKKSEVEEAEVPISSMIDIVFLLIIFFVVTAAIDKEIQDEQVRLADAPHGKPETKRDPRSVTINVRQNGDINMAMQPVNLSQVTNMLLAAAGRWGTDIPIVIRADENTQHHYVKKIMDAVTKTKLYKVKFKAEVVAEKNTAAPAP